MEFHISWKRQIQDNPEKAKSIYPGDSASESGGGKRQILEKAGFFMQPGCPRPPEYGKLCSSGIMVNSAYNMLFGEPALGKTVTSTEPDDDLPRRPAVHVLGDVAEAAFVGLIPNDWIVRKIPSDYGLDLEVEVVTDERVTGATFTVQMKGTDQQLRNDSVQIRIKARSINYWRRRPERVMLAVYAQRENIVLWTWADRIPKPKEDEVSVTIGRANLLADISWPDFASQLQQYYRDRANAYDEKLRTFSARSAETPLAVRLIPIVIGTIEGDSTAETEMIRDFLIRIVLNAEEGKIALEESTKCYPEYSTKFSKRYSIGFKAFARFRRAMTDFFDQVDRIRNLFDGGDSL